VHGWFFLLFGALEVGADVVLQVGEFYRRERDGTLVRALFEDHARTADPGECAAMRLRVGDRFVCDDTGGTTGEALVIGVLGERTIESRRTDLERIRIAEGVERGVDAGGDAFARPHIDAALTVDRDRELRFEAAGACRVRDDFDGAKLRLMRQRMDDAFERFGEQCIVAGLVHGGPPSPEK
jgi:hypothetical protein